MRLRGVSSSQYCWRKCYNFSYKSVAFPERVTTNQGTGASTTSRSHPAYLSGKLRSGLEGDRLRDLPACLNSGTARQAFLSYTNVPVLPQVPPSPQNLTVRFWDFFQGIKGAFVEYSLQLLKYRWQQR
jgi:hypothetical protein